MALRMTTGPVLKQRQRQVQRAIPEQILNAKLLEMNIFDLRQFVTAQAAENPAILLDETSECPWCGGPIGENGCRICGTKERVANGIDEALAQDPFSDWSDEEDRDPFAAIAAPVRLQDYVKEQARLLLEGRDMEIAELLAEALDEDGYLRDDVAELASSYRIEETEVEGVLRKMQAMDPPGVGARTVQECLIIQLSRISSTDALKDAALEIIEKHWDELSSGNIAKLCAETGKSRDEVFECLEYIRQRLDPHPGALYRGPWTQLCPRTAPMAAPDVVVRRKSEGKSELTADVVDVFSNGLRINPAYREAYERLHKPRCELTADEKKHVKESVENAQKLLDAIEMRKATIARIAAYLVREQSAFLTDGPRRLRSMMQKDIAAKLGVHESTVCRALMNKHFQSPSGEVMPFECFFDASLPIKDQIVKMIQSADGSEPLSDGEIADRLQALGWKIARRTVAKYRSQLRLAARDLRALSAVSVKTSRRAA